MHALRWAILGALVGAALSAPGLTAVDLLDERQGWVALVIAAAGSGVTAALAVAAPATSPAQPTRGTVIGAGVLLALVAGGIALWAPGGDDPGTMDTDLGTALLGGAVVACAVVFLQRRLDAEWRQLDEARAIEDEQRRLREQAHVLCAMVHDLTGVDFSGRDLSDTFLRRKILASANLEGSVLRRAVLTEADLSGAVLRKADLVGAQAAHASFRGAILVDAVLTNAVLERADLRGCDLAGAALDGARLTGAQYGDSGRDMTHWPEGFDVAESGALPVP